ncbi:growth hormone receptor-like isoform X2 [Cyprinodon tularosa]|uniref:growth hormone receptor-like isoform X2 n=1 Tax=Cyprinodon tularosa TaxID=77115 RepID=UPI0018E219E8|nr:growth hormone receptor-like isoform X2 [Cyprinodon tularosa]
MARGEFGFWYHASSFLQLRCKEKKDKKKQILMKIMCRSYFFLFTVGPHLINCVSNNMETFRCRWSVGSFQNLSEPRDLRLFYFNRMPPHALEGKWSECPDYSRERTDECFFNKTHTTVWTSYTVQLRSRDQAVLYDEISFSVNDIVQPDPPVGLNWTLMNVSLTSTHFDIMVSWKPPGSADVETGWMALQYEVQHRQVGSEHWEVTEMVRSTHRSLFGLQTNVNHEVRVRCKSFGGNCFGDFSDSVFVNIQSKASRFPVMALLIFGALSLVAILLLVIISHQEKLMFILLPPVPGPKIQGIDPYLLKKGKLRELTSILSGPPDLRPELYNSDPWVEFIDLDIEDHSNKVMDVDTVRLMDLSLSSHCSPLSVGFRDDDSGRSSCCEPDLLSESNMSPVHPLTPKPSQTSAGEQSSGFVEPEPKEAAYTQVGEVRSYGNVLLSPEQLTVEDKNPSKESGAVDESKKKEDDPEEVSSGQRGCTSQSPAAKTGLSDPPESSTSQLSSAPVYTVVEGVDRQNSLLLTPNPTPDPNPTFPKITPTPDGYLPPDLLGSITP